MPDTAATCRACRISPGMGWPCRFLCECGVSLAGTTAVHATCSPNASRACLLISGRPSVGRDDAGDGLCRWRIAGARLLGRLAIRTSDDTVLRRVKAAGKLDAEDAVEVLGVDDWAWRKGRSYGKILVDLDRRSVRDVLADRSAQSFQQWLQQQPRIRVISRDRGGIYAEGVRSAVRPAHDKSLIAFIYF